MIQPDELRRLDFGPAIGEVPDGIGLQVLNVVADGEMGEVVARAKEVLRSVLASRAEVWDPEGTRLRLPAWFIAACAPEPSDEEAGKWADWWRGLDAEGRAKADSEKRWSVDNWLFWLDPDERQWYWWDAVVDDERSARIFVEIDGWPTGLGSLEWLMRAAGASAVEVDD